MTPTYSSAISCTILALALQGRHEKEPKVNTNGLPVNKECNSVVSLDVKLYSGRFVSVKRSPILQLPSCLLSHFWIVDIAIGPEVVSVMFDT